MDEVIKIFKKIKDTSSLNEKKTIIKENKDNELFKKCLVFLLDDNIVTGISDSKLRKLNEKYTLFKATLSLETFEDVMEYLKAHNTGRDEDIANVKKFLYGKWMDDDKFEFYSQMITKKYKLGCDKKVVNKVITGLIPEFNVMLGTSIEKCKLKPNEPISISQKLNGCRCAWIGNKCMTRQGKEYKGLDHIINDLINMGYENMFIDGELLYKNKEGLSDSEAFQFGTGLANSKDGDKSQLKFVVFDIFPLKEFYFGKSKLSYFKRKHTYLEELKSNLKKYPTENIEIVPIFYEGTDYSEIWKWLEYAEQHDYEGCMVNLDVPYECKRTKNLIKVKQFYTYDLKIVGYEEGEGRNKGTLGSFIVEYKNNTVKVGSGYSDSERKNFWENREDYIGRIIEVKYKEISKDKNTGKESLQFPIYVGLRDIGKEVSYD